MEDQQRDRFERAVEKKKQAANEASEQTAGADGAGSSDVSGDQAALVEQGRPQDTRDARKKSSGHGKKTADKWNQ